MNIGGFAGSYPFVETYKFDVPEAELLEIIKEIKTENPELKPRNDSPHKESYWTFVTFSYSDTDEYVNTWTRPSGKGSTTFAFVGLTPKSDIYSGKRINADYYYFANKRQIRKFENQIVNRIKEKIKIKTA